MMKKLLVILALSNLGIVGVYADAIKTTINCTVHGPKGSAINLYQLKDGRAVRLGFQFPDANGNCSFKVSENKEGIYFFAKAGGKGSGYNYVIYLKAGEQKKIDFFLEPLSVDYDSCAVDKPNAETKVLQAWTTAFNKYCTEAVNKPTESYNQYAGFEKSASSFLKTNKTTNAYFNTWIAEKIAVDLKYLRAANFFRFGKRLNTAYDSSAAVKAFYQPLQDKQIVSNASVLRSEHGLDMLHYVFAYWKFNEVKNAKELAAASFSENVPLINNNTVKVKYLAYKMEQITRYEDFVKYIQPYKNLFAGEDQVAYQKKYEDLYLFAKGTPGYNFELKDINDKIYTLAGFKGKVVVIDMWAMWCAPCLAEKPVMEKIAEEFKDRSDIVFVGVSVDGLNRREIWKNFVKKNGFTSIELLSNATESIQKYYKIEGIPRFLIFDREGKIISVDAPRPSNPGFKKMLDAALAAN